VPAESIRVRGADESRLAPIISQTVTSALRGNQTRKTFSNHNGQRASFA
jgi:hypothetical protein